MTASGTTPVRHDPETVKRTTESAVVALQGASQAAADCASHCRQVDAVSMERCIATCEACAAISATTAEVLQIGDATPAEILLEQVRSAYEATRTCATECAEHTAEHCQRCAEVCGSVSDALKTLIAVLEKRSSVTVRLR